MGHGRPTSVGLHLLSGLVGPDAPGMNRPHLRIAGTRRRSTTPPPIETDAMQASVTSNVTLNLTPGHSLGGMYANSKAK